MATTAESQLVNYLPVLIIELDVNGKIFFIGGAICYSLPLRAQEMVGKDFWDLISPVGEELGEWGSDLYEISIKHPRFRGRITGRNGEQRTLYIVLEQVRDVEGEEIRITGFGFEIRGEVGQLVAGGNNVEDALWESQELFERLYQSTPDATILVEEDGSILHVNQATQLIFGYKADELIGRPVEVLLPRKSTGRHIQNRIEFTEKPTLRSMGLGLELFGKRKDGSEFPVEVTLSPMEWQGGLLIICVVRDITSRRQTEQAVQESEDRFRAIFEQTDAGIKLIAPDGRILDSNPALRAMLGYSAEEIHQLYYEELTYPDDREISEAMFKELIEGKRESYRMEKRYRCKDGSVLWGLVTVSIVRDPEGAPRYIITIIENISDRKEIESELDEVRRRLMDSQERERLRLAQELHDGPVQDLYGVTYQIESLRDFLGTNKTNDEINDVQSLLRKVTQSLREICGDLRPPALAPFGLEKAIRSHADQFRQEYPQIGLSLELFPDNQLLPEAVRLALFRIYQHLLINVVRHANATQVWVRFKHVDDQVILEIEDDGVGFRLPLRWIDFVRDGHLGLAGVAERAEAIGGGLEVKTAPGQGTLVRVKAFFN
jgi:two-component system sensor histidine kinase UhpB